MAADRVERLYETMPARLDQARRRFGRGLTHYGLLVVEHAHEQGDGPFISPLVQFTHSRPADLLIGILQVLDNGEDISHGAILNSRHCH